MRERHARGEAPSPLACLLLACPFFLVPTTSKRLLHRLRGGQRLKNAETNLVPLAKPLPISNGFRFLSRNSQEREVVM